MRTTYIVIAAIAGVVLGVLSNWLYDILNRAGVLPSTPTLKRFIVIVVLALPLLVVTILPDLTSTTQGSVAPTNASVANNDLPAPVAIPTAMIDFRNKKISMDCNYDGNRDIYTVNASGENLANITDNPADDWQSAWSPDGQQIAFTSSRDGNYEIYLMNADGSNQKRLTNNTIDDWASVWAYDGSSIIFGSNTSGQWDGKWENFRIKPDGTDLSSILISQLVSVVIYDWSRDGKSILYNTSSDSDKFEIYSIDLGSFATKNLTNSPGEDFNAKWSPDSRKIVFSSYREGNGEIYLMNYDGSSVVNLTNNSADDREPAWSPDGKKLVFVSNRDGRYSVYTMNIDGNNVFRISDGNAECGWPAWQP